MLLLFLVSSLVQAQVGGLLPPVSPQLFPQAVREHLSLTEEQVERIQALQARYSAYAGPKVLRRLQVEQEIAQEAARESLDALALGLRYVELEVIRRELAEERTKTVAAVRALLTEAQKGRAAELERALRDYATACSAAAAFLLEAPEMLTVTTQEDRFSRTTGVVCGLGAWVDVGEFR